MDWDTCTVKFRKEAKKEKAKAKAVPRYDSESEIRALCDKHDFGEENTKTLLKILQAPDLDSVCRLEKHKILMLKMLCRVKHLPGSVVVVVILFSF